MSKKSDAQLTIMVVIVAIIISPFYYLYKAVGTLGFAAIGLLAITLIIYIFTRAGKNAQKEFDELIMIS